MFGALVNVAEVPTTDIRELGIPTHSKGELCAHACFDNTKSTPFALARNMGGHEASHLNSFKMFEACIMGL